MWPRVLSTQAGTSEKANVVTIFVYRLGRDAIMENIDFD
jgi:hypothetical protein